MPVDTVKTPWSSGGVHARLAYDQHIIEQYLNRVEQMRKQQNKRVRTGVLELDKVGANRGSSSTIQTQLRIQPTHSEAEQASSLSTLPLSRKFTQVQTTQGQIQPTSTSSTRTDAAMHTLQFGRPPTAAYPTSIIATQQFNRTEQQVDLSVGHWKLALQRQRLCMYARIATTQERSRIQHQTTTRHDEETHSRLG